MTDKSDWTGKVGQSWADEWRRTDRSFRELTDTLVSMAQDKGFAQALDVGCGAGEVTSRLAQANSSSRVIGVDISDELVAVARDRCAELANTRIELADASQWHAGEGEAPDLLLSRHGVMFFDDPIAAFTHLRSQAADGASLVFSCFRSVAENEWVKRLAATLPSSDAPAPDPHAPGPFAFADRSRVEHILAAAGWSEIAFRAVDYPMIAGEGAEAVEDALSYFLNIGPAARIIAGLHGKVREATIDRLRVVIEAHLQDDVVSLQSAAWIVTARAGA